MRTRHRLVAALCLILSACASTPSMPLTPALPPPAECLNLPSVATQHGVARITDHRNLLAWGPECRQLHAECTSWVELHHTSP